MIISTTETIQGKPVIETLGLVMGNTIRAKDIGKDIGAGLKSIIGGELKSYTNMMTESRNEAVSRMIEQAQGTGANAVIGVKFTTSMVVGGAAEILAYGTAVKI